MTQQTHHAGAEATPDTPEGRASGQTGFDLGGIMTRGGVAGLSGGLVFALANMWFASAHGKPIVAPFLAISTIFHGGSPKPVTDPNEVIAGLTTHLTLSIVFGIIFAVGVALARLGTRPLLLAGAAIGYGLLLYIVNFQIFGRIFFPFFMNPKGPNQLFELWIHPVAFGLVLIPFFLVIGRSIRR